MKSAWRLLENCGRTSCTWLKPKRSLVINLCLPDCNRTRGWSHELQDMFLENNQTSRIAKVNTVWCNGWKMEFLKKLCIALKMWSKRFIFLSVSTVFFFFHSFVFISPVLFIPAVDSAGFDFKATHIRFRYNTPYKKFSLKYKQEIETPQAVYIICI